MMIKLNVIRSLVSRLEPKRLRRCVINNKESGSSNSCYGDSCITVNSCGLPVTHVSAVNSCGLPVTHVSAVNSCGLPVTHVLTVNSSGSAVNCITTVNSQKSSSINYGGNKI
jgi:hypothetical protein